MPNRISSFWIVPVAVAVVRVVPVVGLERVTVKSLLGSKVLSPLTLTVITLLVCPAVKLTVPVGRMLPEKSAALAGLAPLPVTVYLILAVPVLLPLRR